MGDLDDLERRAKTDGAAALSLAEARLMGDGGPPDAAAALALVEQGARLGNGDARRAWVYMVGAGIGRPADPVAPAVTIPPGYKSFDDFSGSKLEWLEVNTPDWRFGYHPNKYFHLETKKAAKTAAALCPCITPPAFARR